MYCAAALETREGASIHPHDSHGICEACIPRAMAGAGERLDDFLDALPGAVLMLDAGHTIVGVNTRGQSLLAAETGHQLVGKLRGEVFQCVNASKPGGCGRTVHCKTCTMRRVVTETFRTGKPRDKVPAYMDLSDITGNRRVRYLISTRKRGDVILLKIDEQRPATPEEAGDR